MTFRGLHEHSLDPKDRITVPAAYRGALSEGIVLRQAVEPCIEVWPAGAAEGMETETLSGLNPLSRDARRLQRSFWAHSDASKLDAGGRILLRKELIKHAGLDGRCVIIGMGTKLEIWDPEAWRAEDEENMEQMPALTEALAAQQALGATGAAAASTLPTAGQ